MILVTGASGFIGSHLVGPLSKSHRVRCLVRKKSVSKIQPSPSVEIMEGDILSRNSVRQALTGVRTVIHMAALLRKHSAQEIRRTNVEATQILVEESSKQSVDYLVFVSTENVLREDLNDPYPATKREAERIVRTFSRHLILRPCFVYGPGDNHGLGRIIELIEKSPVAPLFGGLRCLMQPIYIDDFSRLLIEAVRRELEGSFVIAGAQNLTLNDFIRKVCLIRGKKRLLIPVPYAFFWLSAFISQKLFPKAGWGISQLDNIYGSRHYDMDEKIRALNIPMSSMDEALQRWLS